MVKSLHYLGVYIDQDLKQQEHITIIANRACSTIRGISILGNSVYGLDFAN